MATQTLQLGDTSIDNTWLIARNPLSAMGQGATAIAFNPNDPTQKIYLGTESANQVQSFLGGDNYAETSQLANYFGPNLTGEGSFYTPIFQGTTVEQAAEAKRMADISAQVQSGQIDPYQANALYNTSPEPSTTAATQTTNQPSRTSSRTPSQPSQGLQFPSFDQALLQEYSNRPDLQSLYNPDGSAKNPNDPRIAGIPTLQEWATKYGVNESRLLKTALANPAGRNAPSAVLPTTPVSLNPSTKSTASSLKGGNTAGDLDGLLQGNTKKYGDLRDQILKALMPGQNELQLEKRLADLDAMSRNLNLSAQAGINKIKNQPVAMNFIVGQAKSVMEDANLQLQTLAADRASVVDRLGLAQRARETSLNVLNTLYQFQKEDQALKDQADKLKRAEQESAKEFALQYGISAPFYMIGSTVYNTSTGKPYSTPEEFFKAGGARDWSNIQRVEVQADLEGAPTSYKEYQYAVKEGYKGTYNDYQTMDANRKAVRSTTNIYSSENGDDVVSKLKASVGKDTYADPGVYVELRAKAKSATDFDNKYSYYLSPTQQIRVGAKEGRQ